MSRNFKAVKAAFVLGMLLVMTSLTAVLPASAALINYPSVISIEIAPESLAALQDPVQIEGTLYVKLNIGYAVTVPENLLSSSSLLVRMFVFGGMILPPQQIHLEISGQPEWADIAITTPDVYISDYSNEFVYTSADVVITPYYDAPAVPKSFQITATSQPVGKVLSNTFTTTLTFQPDYIPLINVEVDKPTQQASPKETIQYKMTVKNLGNKETLVSGRVTDTGSEWATILTPTQILIPPGETATMTFSLTTPYDFGWHNELRTFSIELTPQRSPPSSNTNSSGTPYNVQLQVNSVGFSLPGFELATTIAALAVSALLIARRKRR